MASTCNHVLVAGELKQCIEQNDLDKLLYFTVRYKNADKLKIAEDYFTLTNRMLTGDIARLASKDVGELLAASWKYYLDVKATFIHDAFKSKTPRRGIELSLMSSPDEWIGLRKAYAGLYKEDMEQVIRKVCPQNTITTRILIAWIAYRRTPRNSPTEDIANLYAAATGKGMLQKKNPVLPQERRPRKAPKAAKRRAQIGILY